MYENIKKLVENILGGLANNLGNTGAGIVAYIENTNKKVQELINKNININGEVEITPELENELQQLYSPLLAEFGKENYDIVFVKGDEIGLSKDVVSSVNDEKGIISINLDAAYGFGDSKALTQEIRHEGMHGTYANWYVDENATTRLSKNYDFGKSLGYNIDSTMESKISTDTINYFVDRISGELRNATLEFKLGNSLYCLAFDNEKLTIDFFKIKEEKNKELNLELSLWSFNIALGINLTAKSSKDYIYNNSNAIFENFGMGIFRIETVYRKWDINNKIYKIGSTECHEALNRPNSNLSIRGGISVNLLDIFKNVSKKDITKNESISINNKTTNTRKIYDNIYENIEKIYSLIPGGISKGTINSVLKYDYNLLDVGRKIEPVYLKYDNYI